MRVIVVANLGQVVTTLKDTEPGATQRTLIGLGVVLLSDVVHALRAARTRLA